MVDLRPSSSMPGNVARGRSLFEAIERDVSAEASRPLPSIGARAAPGAAQPLSTHEFTSLSPRSPPMMARTLRSQGAAAPGAHRPGTETGRRPPPTFLTQGAGTASAPTLALPRGLEVMGVGLLGAAPAEPPTPAEPPSPQLFPAEHWRTGHSPVLESAPRWWTPVPDRARDAAAKFDRRHVRRAQSASRRPLA